MNVTRRRRPWAIGMIVFLGLLAVASYILHGSLLPIFIAFALAYAFSPVVDWLERKGVSRGWGTALLLVGLIAGLVLAIGSFLPMLIREAAQFINQLPDFLSTAVMRVAEVGERYGLRIPLEPDAIVDRARRAVQGLSLSAMAPVVSFTKRLVTGAGGFVVAILNLLIVPVFFFYFLRDLPKTRSFVLDLVPIPYRPYALQKFDDFDRVLSGYLRGQMLVALILGVVFSVGLLLLGVKFGLVIGIAAGILQIIPYLGQLTGFALSMVMVLVDFTGWGRVIAIPVMFAVTNFIEGTFISPKIVGSKVGLSPVWAIIALIIGGEIAGFFGLIAAIPAAGCLRVILLDLVNFYKRSELYKGPAAPVIDHP